MQYYNDHIAYKYTGSYRAGVTTGFRTGFRTVAARFIPPPCVKVVDSIDRGKMCAHTVHRKSTIIQHNYQTKRQR